MTRQMQIVVLLTVGAVLAVDSLLLRAYTDGKYEIQTIDLILLVIPLVVLALATGKLRSLDVFGLKADFSDLWAAVGQTEIRNQVSEPSPSTLQGAVDVNVLEMARKASLQELPQLIGRQLEALEFKLGHGEYDRHVIEEYFKALSGSLRVVVVNDPEGKLFGIYNAPDLISSLRFTGESGYRQLAELLNSTNEEVWPELAQLPGFVGADNAVTESTSKRDALAKMEELNTDILPVVNDERGFIGTVGRSKLTAGLILAVTNALEGRWSNELSWCSSSYANARVSYIREGRV
jgi:CBS domain-containing protein